MKRTWRVSSQHPTAAELLAQTLGVSNILASLLINRGLTDQQSAAEFLEPSFQQLHDPSLLYDMDRALARVVGALESNERILIYGDYDVDGTTGTVVLRRVLELLGATTGYHIPHRLKDGYGIQLAALERAKAEGYGLVISVDCGIRAFEPLLWARANGLDVIVTDHHLPDEKAGSLPAFAVLNPNQRACNYPDKHLAGVAVAFKLAHALLRAFGREHLVQSFLKLVAIGTVADVAQLVGENRAIVALGLRDLPQAANQGLRALIAVAGLGAGAQPTAYDLGFRIGPRINAAGRMDSAHTVVELFEAKTAAKAELLAQRLDWLNLERRRIQAEIVAAAQAQAALRVADANVHVLVLAAEGWHRGVIGIAASKLVDSWLKPCIVLAIENGAAHGSGRSIESYHLLDGLTACADMLVRFGGHAHAVGLTLAQENLHAFERMINAHAAELPGSFPPQHVLQIDAEVESHALKFELFSELERLQPFGAGNARPLFVCADLKLAGAPQVLKEKHLKFKLRTSDERILEAVWWDGNETKSNRTLLEGTRIKVAFNLEASHWRGASRLQLIVKDVVKE